MNKKLIVIVGPTASGKTALSVRVAKLFDTEIISADSRQLYKEMSIGTAKPSVEEMEGVKHHFINSHSVTEDYNIGKYERDALEAADKIFQHKDIAVLVGGSGLYVKVVTEGMDEIPDAEPELRNELNKKAEEGKLEELLEELKEADPEFYEVVDKSNPQRIIRALEVCRSTGKPFSEFRTGSKKKRPFEIIKIGLLRDREELYERIDKRMDQMIADGLFEEAQSLYPYREKNALQTVGYKEIFDFMEGKYDREEAIRLLKRNTRRFAKRQMTWFRRDAEISWFYAGDEKQIVEFIKRS